LLLEHGADLGVQIRVSLRRSSNLVVSQPFYLYGPDNFDKT